MKEVKNSEVVPAMFFDSSRRVGKRDVTKEKERNIVEKCHFHFDQLAPIDTNNDEDDDDDDDRNDVEREKKKKKRTATRLS